MQPRRFTHGQPVISPFDKTKAYKVIGYEYRFNNWYYTLEDYSGNVVYDVEGNLKRMKPLPKESKPNGRTRTAWGYFFSIRGGLST